MKKALCLLLAACMLLAAGCAATTSVPPAATSAASDNTITIIDHNGASVTVPRDIQRIAVCDILPLPSVLSVFFNSAEKIVGASQPSLTAAENGLLGELYPELLKASTGFINGSDVNTEELMKLNPDVVFYNASSSALGEKLKTAGFNAVAISVNKWNYNAIETLNNWIALLSELFPESAKAAEVETYSNNVYAMIQERVATLADADRKNVFFLFKYTDTTINTSGKNFFGQWWADAIGAVNVASEITTDNSAQVNMEQIYAWNPEIVFVTNFTTAQPDALYTNAVGAWDWSAVTAVQKQQVYKMPLGMYRSYTPGADTPMTLLWLAKTTYPNLFSDIDLTQEVKDYYSQVFGVTLTDAQVESIFAPTAAAAAGF